jgi:hypothetical protein
MSDTPIWRLPECWTLTHSGGEEVRLDATQDGNTIVGTAHKSSVLDAPEATGIVSGWLVGDEITLTIYWPDGPAAEYQGLVSNDGEASGTVLEKTNEAASEQWRGQSQILPWENGYG